MDNGLSREQVAQWVGALRSGAYRQGHSALLDGTPYYGEVSEDDHDEDLPLLDVDNRTYCCLGVLGELQGLPLESLMAEIFLGSDYGEAQSILVTLNDGAWTFAQIADFLESAGDPTLWDFYR